jgi:hypothetical protein
VTEVLKQTNSKKARMTGDDGIGGGKVDTKMPSMKEIWSIKWTMVRCSVVGTVVGILPGAGATIASFMCYTMENKISKYPEKWGTGIIDGIAASEASNNAATGGAMVPLLSLGIPGGNAAAVMMSALTLKGVHIAVGAGGEYHGAHHEHGRGVELHDHRGLALPRAGLRSAPAAGRCRGFGLLGTALGPLLIKIPGHSAYAHKGGILHGITGNSLSQESAEHTGAEQAAHTAGSLAAHGRSRFAGFTGKGLQGPAKGFAFQDIEYGHGNLHYFIYLVWFENTMRKPGRQDSVRNRKLF